MKNITLSAKEEAIEKARRVAVRNHSTLNQMFREWLETFNNQRLTDEGVSDKLNSIWEQANYVRVGKKLSRNEMNER